jgi:hypothetical protein
LLRLLHVEKDEDELEGPAISKKATKAQAALQAQYEAAQAAQAQAPRGSPQITKTAHTPNADLHALHAAALAPLPQPTRAGHNRDPLAEEKHLIKETPVNRVLMQTSTTGLIDVRAVMTEHKHPTFETDIPLPRKHKYRRSDLSTVEVSHDKWPFYLEHQADVASAGLVRMLAQLKNDAEMQAVKFITHYKRFKQLDREINFTWKKKLQPLRPLLLVMKTSLDTLKLAVL